MPISEFFFSVLGIFRMTGGPIAVLGKGIDAATGEKGTLEKMRLAAEKICWFSAGEDLHGAYKRTYQDLYEHY